MTDYWPETEGGEDPAINLNCYTYQFESKKHETKGVTMIQVDVLAENRIEADNLLAKSSINGIGLVLEFVLTDVTES